MELKDLLPGTQVRYPGSRSIGQVAARQCNPKGYWEIEVAWENGSRSRQCLEDCGFEVLDPRVVEVETRHGKLQVVRLGDGYYNVVLEDQIRHPRVDAEGVMRALGNYLQASSK